MKNKMKAELTTDSPCSHYGIPVLRINGRDLGPRDQVKSDSEYYPWENERSRSAAQFVREAFLGLCPWESSTLGDIEQARLFCSQWPDGPQPE